MRWPRPFLIVLVVVLFLAALLIVLNTSTGHANAQAVSPSPTIVAPTTAPEPPAYDHRNDVTGSSSSAGSVTRSGTCATSTDRIRYYGLGGTLFTWNQSAHWCWNSANTRVTSASFSTFYTLGGQLWNLWRCLQCPSSVVSGGGTGTAYVYRRSYAAFGWCITNYCQSRTTFVAQTVRPNGGYTGSSG